MSIREEKRRRGLREKERLIQTGWSGQITRTRWHLTGTLKERAPEAAAATVQRPQVLEGMRAEST